jgi:hypothetical protein
VLFKRRSVRQTSSRWRFSRKNDWIVQVTPQQAIKAVLVLVLSTRYSEGSDLVIGRQELGYGTCYYLLRRWVFTAVCCVF